MDINLAVLHGWPLIPKTKLTPDSFRTARLSHNHDRKNLPESAWRFRGEPACGVFATAWVAFSTLRAAVADFVESADRR